MNHALRVSIRKSFVVTLTVAVLGVGYAGYQALGGSLPGHRASTSAPTRFTASDLLKIAAAAQAGIFLQFDGVTGPPAGQHGAHATITSMSFGVGRNASISGGVRTVSKPSVSEINLSHEADKYSVPFLNESLRGSGAGNAVLYFTKLNDLGKGVNYIEFDLEGALVTGYQASAGSPAAPSESISLNFTKFTMKALFGTSQSVSYDLLTGT
jgi:type VI secretion system secreted protein Hcp